MRRQTYNWIWILIAVALAACQPRINEVPTLIDLNAISTNDAATAQANAQNAEATGAAQAATMTADSVTQTAVAIAHQPTPLPPSWTPSPPATEPPAPLAPPTQEQVTAPGTLYFIFNGDSIAALKADASSEKLILVGGAPAELTLSPDGQYLAYTAQGNGSAREVFITTLDGTYVQAVSCLGFARVTALAWSPDSQTLAFAVSQTLDGPLGIYTAGIIGSGQCPTGNNQRLLTQTDLNKASAMTWSNDGAQLFFASDVIYGYDLANSLFYPPLTTASGYGPDSNSVYRPGTNDLYYLKTFYDASLKSVGGKVFHFATTSLNKFPIPGQAGAAFAALQISWSRDGRYLLVSTDNDIFVQDTQSGSASPIMTGSNFFPQAVFSPAADWVAFVDGKPGALTIPEIFVITLDGRDRHQITFHQEGTIRSLNWGAG